MKPSQLDKLTRPSFEYIKHEGPNEKNENLDKIIFKSTLFVKFEDYTNKTIQDFTI